MIDKAVREMFPVESEVRVKGGLIKIAIKGGTMGGKIQKQKQKRVSDMFSGVNLGFFQVLECSFSGKYFGHS